MKIKNNLSVFFVFLISLFSQNCSAQFQSRGTVHSADVATLKLTQVVFRHGDRTPFSTYPLDPYKDMKYWPDGFGQLTKKGKMMHYDLGGYFQWRYSGFLSKSYSRTEVHARSSDTDRTIMSAQANLAGLFPPNYDDQTSYWNPLIKWQPIPIRTIPTDMDRLIRFDANCPRYNKLFVELQGSPPVRDLNRDHNELYEYLSKHTGWVIDDYKGAADLYDTLFIEQLYDLPLPDWTISVFPEKMKHLGIMEFKMAGYTEEMKKLLGGPLLADIIRHMDMTINPPKIKPKNFNSAKMQMYSGHDTTVAALLSVLGIYDECHIPPYASTVMVELHKGNVTVDQASFDQDSTPPPPIMKEEYYVRIFYRNESGARPREFEIPGCVTEDSSHKVCTIEKFKSLLSHRVVKNWEEECGIDFASPPPEDIGFYNRLSMATGGKILNDFYDAWVRFYMAYIAPLLGLA